MCRRIRSNKYLKALPHILLLLNVLLLQPGCESADQTPVQQVNSSDRLSEDQLSQLYSEKNINSPKTSVYRFGFDLRSSPQEDAAQYVPFLNYLEKETGYHFELHFTPRNRSTSDELGKNITQFAAMGAISYIEANQKYGAISLVRGINQSGKAEYRSYLVTVPGSSIKSVKDIRGQRVAFGSEDSTQGHLIPRIVLKQHGIELTDLKSYDYTGSHQNCAEAVIAGRADVCGMQDQLAQTLSDSGLIRILHRSSYYPSSGIVGNKLLNSSVLDRVEAALLKFDPNGKDKKGLYNWHKTEMVNGFVQAKASDYDELKQLAYEFGFIKK